MAQEKQSKTTLSQSNYRSVSTPTGFPGLPEGWASEWETFPSADGQLKLFGVTHFRQNPAGRRALIVFHGQGEHGGRYTHVPHFVQNEIDVVYCLDHRGHGRSEGLRGHVDHFDQYVADAALVVDRVSEKLKSQLGSSEIHILGHSMGGLITTRLLFNHASLPIQAATITSPLLGIKMKVPPLKKYAGIVLSNILGKLQMTSGVDPATLSRDPALQECYASDRLVHSKVTPKFFTELQAAMADTLKHTTGPTYPIQVLIPPEDALVDSDISLPFFQALKCHDKEIKTYPGYRHEILNDIGKEKVFEDLVSWLIRHHSKS